MIIRQFLLRQLEDFLFGHTRPIPRCGEFHQLMADCDDRFQNNFLHKAVIHRCSYMKRVVAVVGLWRRSYAWTSSDQDAVVSPENWVMPCWWCRVEVCLRQGCFHRCYRSVAVYQVPVLTCRDWCLHHCHRHHHRRRRHCCQLAVVILVMRADTTHARSSVASCRGRWWGGRDRGPWSSKVWEGKSRRGAWWEREAPQLRISNPRSPTSTKSIQLVEQ